MCRNNFHIYHHILLPILPISWCCVFCLFFFSNSNTLTASDWRHLKNLKTFRLFHIQIQSRKQFIDVLNWKLLGIRKCGVKKGDEKQWQSQSQSSMRKPFTYGNGEQWEQNSLVEKNQIDDSTFCCGYLLSASYKYIFFFHSLQSVNNSWPYL